MISLNVFATWLSNDEMSNSKTSKANKWRIIPRRLSTTDAQGRYKKIIAKAWFNRFFVMTGLDTSL